MDMTTITHMTTAIHMTENNTGKVAIITGASRGIGRAVAELFAQNGYKIVINYCRSYESALKLHEDLTQKGFEAIMCQADITQRAQVENMVMQCMTSFGSIDVLVNNAGIAQQKLFQDIPGSEWDDMMNVHVKGMFNCCQAVLPHMLKEKRGKIINISSVWGMVGASCEVHYSTAKAAVIGFTKALAKELGPSNINVNCIAPGVIDTDMLCSFSEDEKAELKDMTPLSRLGTARDVADLCLFLASDQADFITGQVISPNGGFVI
jgi:3-oxoacyl-[acyl-carrier protein] reductase